MHSCLNKLRLKPLSSTIIGSCIVADKLSAREVQNFSNRKYQCFLPEKKHSLIRQIPPPVSAIPQTVFNSGIVLELIIMLHDPKIATTLMQQSCGKLIASPLCMPAVLC